ncbi:hypothetical protein GA0061078_0427 [Bifidobacterium bohemicum]|uniref:DUF4190 domain-containing protein n=1 Tax=Bifidobacterium bohemicum DSM 22767 TaxID=1437606 RepID=A0A086ZJH5_9BIFI|nr:DUF4190 domain-containing protein [Bifidobacterium bohemicum]KFI46675.1 hypothetical protein BBOH_0147 [Bifidobacterium bohemicum DSM 22767]SCB78476.1 hypothetical protein GA0061078_0427 [Bifidobacterium bohemicum]
MNNNDDQINRTGDSGQSATPEFGAMSSQFGAGYNPYLYGAPEPKDNGQPDGGATPVQTGMPGNGGVGNQGQNPFGYGFRNPGDHGNQGGVGNSAFPAGQNGYPGAPGYGYPNQPMRQNEADPYPGQPGYQPDIYNGIDMNDPSQNPLKGRWDAFAILAFVLAFIGNPVFPLIFGAISLHRTKKFHMKGRGLAWAAVIIGVLVLILEIWLWSQGFNPMDYMQQMLNSGSGNNGGGGSVNA